LTTSHISWLAVWARDPSERTRMPNQQPTLSAGQVLDVSLEDRMEQAFLDYSMSVIVGRALPDVRDGLKPVQRRILYSMWESGLHPDRPYRKCASAVGEVMKTYHPHGDSSIYDALVRMAQDFATREPLVDGHGNFGSVDGDPPAAMRYTEARLSPLAMELLAGIDESTVDFVENYDGYDTEPLVLPARFPNLLVNGASGIAVGMATNIPPHNLGEVIDACLHLIGKPDATLDQLTKLHPRARLPDRRPDHRRRRHPAGLQRRSRRHHRRGGRHHRDPHRQPAPDRHHRDPLPGQQGVAAAAHRRPGRQPQDRGDPRPARRVLPRRDAHRHRAQARRGPAAVLAKLYKLRPTCAPTSTSTSSRWSTAPRAPSGCTRRSPTTSPTSATC
jgi:hypothetical protein